MKTYPAQWPIPGPSHSVSKPRNRRAITLPISAVVAPLTAAIAATVIMVMAIWAAGHGAQNMLATLSWMSGIVFLALAVDSRDPISILQLATGLSLLALAWLCSRVSPEFGIVSAFVIAAWVMVPISRKLHQSAPALEVSNQHLGSV